MIYGIAPHSHDKKGCIHDRPIRSKSFPTTSLISEVMPICSPQDRCHYRRERGSKGCSLSTTVASADGRPAYPALPMFTVLLLQRGYGLEQPLVRGSGHRSDLLYPLQRVLPLSTLPDHSTLCRSGMPSWHRISSRDSLRKSIDSVRNGDLGKRIQWAILDAPPLLSPPRPRTVTEELSLPVISYSDDRMPPR